MNDSTFSPGKECSFHKTPAIRLFSSQSVKYCPPACAGWGIVRVGLLVPESALLFISPSGCARHAAIAGIQLGFWDRFFCYRIHEAEIVSGEYLEGIPKAAHEIIRRSGMKALIICSTCIDDLLGSDYDSLVARIERDTGVSVRLCRMDPICMDTVRSPPLAAQETIYRFLSPTGRKDGSVNLIGNFTPVTSESELERVLFPNGDGEIRHIADYQTFGSFQEMADSSFNLLVKPAGSLAVRDMNQRLGIPWIPAYHAYGIERIDAMYKTLEQVLGRPLDTGTFREEAVFALESFREDTGEGASVAIGSTANAAPFELARTFLEAGIDVRYVFADGVQSWEEEHLSWIEKHHPSLEIFMAGHPRMADAGSLSLSADFAIGFDAGYYCPGAKTLPWGYDSQPFGYQGLISLLKGLSSVQDSHQNLKEMIYASGLVI